MKQIFARISWIWVVIGWTFFLWLSRLRNVVTNDEFSSSARSIRIGIVVGFPYHFHSFRIYSNTFHFMLFLM